MLLVDQQKVGFGYVLVNKILETFLHRKLKLAK